MIPAFISNRFHHHISIPFSPEYMQVEQKGLAAISNLVFPSLTWLDLELLHSIMSRSTYSKFTYPQQLFSKYEAIVFTASMINLLLSAQTSAAPSTHFLPYLSNYLPKPLWHVHVTQFSGLLHFISDWYGYLSNHLVRDSYTWRDYTLCPQKINKLIAVCQILHRSHHLITLKPEIQPLTSHNFSRMCHLLLSQVIAII